MEDVVLTNALVKFEGLFLKKVFLALFDESVLVWTVEVPKLFDTVLFVFINLGKLVNHHFVKTA